MAPLYLSWTDSDPKQANNQTQDHLPSYNYTQGATCQPLENASTHHFTQQSYHSPEAFVASSPTIQFMPSPPPLTFDSSPDEQYSAMDRFELDHDILNNLSHLDDVDLNLTDYHDFELLPGAQNFQCQFGDCSESFARRCELTRHECKHTRPFKCSHCGRAFAEKRRCVQHVQSVHDLATYKDKTKCHLCKYAHVRPDAVKRHLRLKHGVGVKYQSSPSTLSDGQSDKEAARWKERKEQMARR